MWSEVATLLLTTSIYILKRAIQFPLNPVVPDYFDGNA